MFLLRLYLWFKDLMEQKSTSKEGRREREIQEMLTSSGSGGHDSSYLSGLRDKK